MSDSIVALIIVIAAIVTLVGMWRYNTLNVRGRILGLEGELKGKHGKSNQPTLSSSVDTITHKVDAKIGGSVKGSTVSVAARNISEQPNTNLPANSDVRVEIAKDVHDSDVTISGGDIS